MIAFVVPGKPQAKQRPRLANGFAYTPKETVEYENWVKLCYRNANQPTLEGELEAEITFGFPIPKSKLKQAQAGARPTTKPDLDNLAKAVLDSLNGLAYHDDSQIVELLVRKVYDAEPKVVVVIKERE